MGRRVVFLDGDITVEAKGGMFYCDTGVEGSALIATTPHLLLRHIEAMRRAYREWESQRCAASALRKASG